MKEIQKFMANNKAIIDEAMDVIMPQLVSIRAEYGELSMVDAAYNIVGNMNKREGVEDKITCGNCSFCCYASIHMTTFEKDYMLQGLARKQVDINEDLLIRQNKKAWHKLKYADKKCILLDEKGKCSNYEYRPMICRLWNSTDDPKLCDDSEGKTTSGTVRVVQAWAVYFALIQMDLTEGAAAIKHTIHGELIKHMEDGK